MDFEEYKRKLLEEDERNRLSELQTKYNGMGTPNYSNMSLHDQLQTRFDLSELNDLQNKYGVQQQTTLQPTTGFGSSTTSVPDYMSALKVPSVTSQPNYNINPQPQISTLVPQPTHAASTQPTQTKPYGWSYLLQKLNPISTANAAEYHPQSQATPQTLATPAQVPNYNWQQQTPIQQSGYIASNYSDAHPQPLD